MRYLEDISDASSRKKAANVLDWFETIAYAFAVLLLLFTFFIRISTVSGDSMNDTLKNGDGLLISGFCYQPQQGDIVVVSKLYQGTKPLVKRVIATENQTIDIDFETGTVTVDGEVLQEDYIKELTTTQYDVTFPVTVPENCVFVMGDNRNRSTDSRSSAVGMIDERYVLGKVIYRYFPFSSLGVVE